MAVLETKIYTALTGNATIAAVVNSRIYPLVIPQNPTLPAITYQRVSGQHINTLDGFANLENAHIAISIYATRYDSAKELAEDVHKTMDEARTFRALLSNDADGYDPETGLFYISQDWSCWDHTT